MEVKVEYSEPLIKTVTRRFWLKYLGRSTLIVFAFLFAYLLYLVWAGYRNWYIGAVATIIFLGLIVFPTAYFVYLNRSLTIYRKMSEPTAIIGFGDDELSYRSDLGSSTLKWRAIKKVWRFPEAWLFFVTDWQYINVPIASVPETTRQFILSKIQQSGGRID